MKCILNKGFLVLMGHDSIIYELFLNSEKVVYKLHVNCQKH